MGTENRYDGIEEYAVWLIRRKARELTGRGGFTESDQEDIEQEMMLDLLKRLPKYDPEKAQRNTFIARIVEHKVSSLIREREAVSCDYRRTRSLDASRPGQEGDTQSQGVAVDFEQYLLRTGKKHRGTDEDRDLKAFVSNQYNMLLIRHVLHLFLLNPVFLKKK